MHTEKKEFLLVFPTTPISVNTITAVQGYNSAATEKTLSAFNVMTVSRERVVEKRVMYIRIIREIPGAIDKIVR